MTIIKFIPQSEVVDYGFKLVKKAKKSLYLTMIMKDELVSTPPEYLTLLKQKITQGLQIKRIGFGNKKDYHRSIEQIGYKHVPDNFIFRYCNNINLAQRLLISDEKEMLFAVYKNKHQKAVFYTRSKPIIKGFLNYFKIISCKKNLL